MANYSNPDDEETATNSGNTEGVGDSISGIGGAIPGVNIIAPGIGAALSGMAQQQAREQGIKDLSSVQTPDFNQNNYQNEAYAGDFSPTLFAKPDQAQYQTTSEDPRLRQMQMDALDQLSDGLSSATQAKLANARYGAMNDANNMANAREGNIRMDAERSGQLGNGTNELMRAQAAQMGANRAQAGTLQAAQDAALEKLQNEQAMMSASGQLRGQDFANNSANANTINKFNMFNTEANNQANQGNVGMQNAAGSTNLSNRQNFLNANVGINNRSLDRNDQNKQNTFNDAFQKESALAGDFNNQAQGEAGQNTASQAAGKQGADNFKDLMMMGA